MSKNDTTIPATAQADNDFDFLLAADSPVLSSSAPAIQGEPVAYKGQPVLTTEQAAKAFQVDAGTMWNNHNRHRDRFEEGKHFYRIVGDELRELKRHYLALGEVVARQAPHLILWTKRGIARHAKLIDTEKAWEVYEDLEETYFRVKEAAAAAQVPALPNFADPASAARAWAEQYEGRVLAERKKAEIGSKREATAMSTARWAKDRAQRLEIELDRAVGYATVKRMEIAYGRKFPFAPLRTASRAMDLEIRVVPDPNFGSVKSYHARAWREAYGVDVPGWTGPDLEGETADAR